MTAIPPRIGRLHRARLLHPCRFYAYGWAVLLSVALVVVGIGSGEWRPVTLALVSLALMVPGIEAAARSTVGPADVLRAAADAAKYREANNL